MNTTMILFIAVCLATVTLTSARHVLATGEDYRAPILTRLTRQYGYGNYGGGGGAAIANANAVSNGYGPAIANANANSGGGNYGGYGYGR